MIRTFVLVSAWLLNTGLCMELNSLEVSPFYDAIIFGDIAEIINDIDNNMNLQTDKKQNSEYESDEEVESLLSEYQHYLEKAEKQRAKHFEKTKIKNKVPLLHRERFAKINLSKPQTNNKNSNYYTSNILLPKQVYKHPNNLFEALQIFPGETSPPFNKMIWNENKINDFPSYIQKPQNNEILSSCFCEENKFPCKCNCKQCLIPLDKNVGPYFEPSETSIKDNSLITHSNSYTNIGYFNENADDKPDNNLNIRIKFDIQLPKINEMLKKLYNNLFSLNKTKAVENTDTVNDTNTPISISSPDLTFPIPLSIFSYGLSKVHKYDFSPIHKMSLHKKKKTHTNYQNKKHRSKFLPLHHSKGTSQSIQTTDVYSNDSNNINILSKGTELLLPSNTTRVLETSTINNTSDVNFLDNGHNIFNMSTYVNVSNDDNIVEVDTTALNNPNTTNTRWEPHNATETTQILRIKREHKLAVIDNDTVVDNNSLKFKGLINNQKDEETNKKGDNKQQLLNSDLLYWPIKSENVSKNITSPVRKLQYNNNVNVTEYGTSLNASWQKALSRINWTDIDIAASTFSSLVGKHANGILTFCSEKRCRSVKCSEKLCVQRMCLLEERYNQKGHCGTTSNERDTTIVMESSLDVSFEIACELAETLQSQMLGFTYGKTTICINVKCITLVANKKSFTKTKCSKKQLTAEGHCESLKNVKVV